MGISEVRQVAQDSVSTRPGAVLKRHINESCCVDPLASDGASNNDIVTVENHGLAGCYLPTSFGPLHRAISAHVRSNRIGRATSCLDSYRAFTFGPNPKVRSLTSRVSDRRSCVLPAVTRRDRIIDRYRITPTNVASKFESFRLTYRHQFDGIYSSHIVAAHVDNLPYVKVETFRQEFPPALRGCNEANILTVGFRS